MGTKSIFASKVFWGSVMSLLALFFPGLFKALGWSPAHAASYIVGAIGFAFTVYGRLVATKTVTLTGAPSSAPPLGS
jgi:hypothetical protein